jgi:ubiquinone/menaquinone biosynthesis C-methylase UbiE
MEEQRKLILDQFTRQAVPFSGIHAGDGGEVHQLLIRTAGITAADVVLDVACGPGLVACEVAKVARHVTGIDLTPAMIEQARGRQQSFGLASLSWVQGDAQPLPFPDATFSRVVTRYSFHHFTDPKGVFAEMLRVCDPGGRVTVCDVFTASDGQSELYDRLERPREALHAHALQLAGLDVLFAGLGDQRREFYRYPVKVEKLLSRSFPGPGGVREMVVADVGVDRIGIAASSDGGRGFSFPVVIVSGTK